jgi:ribosome-associated protein
MELIGRAGAFIGGPVRRAGRCRVYLPAGDGRLSSGSGRAVVDGKKRRLPGAVSPAVTAIEDRKGRRIMVLDLRGLNDATDFFIVASGTSDTHVRGLADNVIREMARAGHAVHHIEGLPAGRWVLLDFVDVVVHLFHPETRAFYRLETLWQDAPVLHQEQ